MPYKRRVVITGLGAVAPNGIGKDAFWEALIEGKSGIGRITRFDVSAYSTKLAGEVKNFGLHTLSKRKKLKQVGRATQFALVSAREALKDSNLIINSDNSKYIGVSIGTAIADIGLAAKEYKVQLEKGPLKANPFMAIYISPNSCSGIISMVFRLHGPSSTISTVCASSLNAIDYAVRLIKSNIANVMIAGGTEAPLFEPVFDTFSMINVMSTQTEKTPRPFDKNRNGFILSEGSGIIILEELNHAIKRKANIYAEVLGIGITCDAYSPVKLNPNAEEMARAIKMALEESQLNIQDIEYINPHGLGTKSSDHIETKAIKKIFGKYAYNIPISSIKSMIGQPIGASGVLQLISSVLTIKNSIIPPTINYENFDPDCDLDYVPKKSRKQNIKTALINSFGFGGKYISLIVKKIS